MTYPTYGREREFTQVYVLLPPTAHGAWAENAAAAAYDKANKTKELNRYTIGADPDEAARIDGRMHRIIVAVNPHEWMGLFGREGLKFFLEAHYGLGDKPNLEYQELVVKNPPQLYLQLYELKLRDKSRSTQNA